MVFTQFAFGAVLYGAAEAIPTITISGHSSGGDMAEQHFIAHSKDVMGLAHIASAPYACGATNATFSTSECTHSGSNIDLSFLIQYTDGRAFIDSPANIRGRPVYVFSDLQDHVVPQSVVSVAAEFYKHYGADVQTKFDLPAGHAFITDSYGNPCGSTYPPFVNNCGYDMAGAALSHIYGNLRPRAQADAFHFVTVDQAKYGANRGNGMGQQAFAYVPSSCSGRIGSCRIHLVYHGCNSSVSTSVGDQIYKHTGYNDWAEANDIVVLYPQAYGSDCWDWTATYGPNFDTQKGVQISIVNAMVQGLIDGDAIAV